MFWLAPPCSALLQPLLPLPFPVQAVRAWKIAMPAVAPVVGAVRLTVACALIDMMPGPLLPLAKTSVTPPVVSPGHAVEMVGVVVEVGGALMVAPPAPALSSSEEPLLNT